jgi:tRNA threonylcarbamoyladenosine biosynthesis protein TsaE
VYLAGDLGAGKTTWVRGFLATCGVTALVRSPTYTLVELYDLGAVQALHLDLYRLQDEAEFEALGLRDWAQPGYLWLIEWPERALGRLPAADLRVTLSVSAQGHEIRVEAASLLGEEWLRRAQA